MNVYVVMSTETIETYTRGGWNLPEDADIPESFCIAEIVVAKTRGQARYLVYRRYQADLDQIYNMPKISIRVLVKGVEIPKGVLNGEQAESYWALVKWNVQVKEEES